MVNYGWYSDKAFNFNGIGYTWTDVNNKSVICTSITRKNKNPYDTKNNIFKKDSRFVGIMTKYISSIHIQTKKY